MMILVKVKRSRSNFRYPQKLNDVILRKHSLMVWKVENVYSRSAANYRLIRGHVQL